MCTKTKTGNISYIDFTRQGTQHWLFIVTLNPQGEVDNFLSKMQAEAFKPEDIEIFLCQNHALNLVIDSPGNYEYLSQQGYQLLQAQPYRIRAKGKIERIILNSTRLFQNIPISQTDGNGFPTGIYRKKRTTGLLPN
jgi:hypothetical protein